MTNREKQANDASNSNKKKDVIISMLEFCDKNLNDPKIFGKDV